MYCCWALTFGIIAVGDSNTSPTSNAPTMTVAVLVLYFLKLLFVIAPYHTKIAIKPSGLLRTLRSFTKNVLTSKLQTILEQISESMTFIKHILDHARLLSR